MVPPPRSRYAPTMALTPDEEATIEHVTVFFSISGFDEDPDEITSLLDLAPDQVARRSDASGEDENWWLLRSRLRSKDVNDHLRGLLGRMRGKADRVRAEWRPSFSVLWRGRDLVTGGGPVYDRDVVAGIAELGAELVQDIYQLVPSDR